MRHKHKHRHDYRSPYGTCTLLYGKAIYKPIEIVAGYVEPLCVKVKMHQVITEVATRHVTIIPTDFVVTRLMITVRLQIVGSWSCASRSYLSS